MVERFVDYLSNPFSNLINTPTVIVETTKNNLWIQSIIATNTGDEDIRVNLKFIRKKTDIVSVTSAPTQAGELAGSSTVTDGNVTTITDVTVIPHDSNGNNNAPADNITVTTVTVITLTEIFLAKDFLVPSYRNSAAQQNGVLYNTADLVKILGLPINLQFDSGSISTEAISDKLIIYSNSPTQAFDCCVIYSRLNELPMSC